MLGVKVQDGVAEGGALAFDLREILTALGAPALESLWRARDVTYVADEDVVVLDAVEAGTGAVTGAELLAASRRVHQVIDGEFLASLTPGAAPWLVVRAVDSSWWEVWSDDPSALAAIRGAFTAVEPLTD